jgi:hypothetical protein
VCAANGGNLWHALAFKREAACDGLHDSSCSLARLRSQPRQAAMTHQASPHTIAQHRYLRLPCFHLPFAAAFWSLS